MPSAQKRPRRKHILLTGPPGIGKTTVITRLVSCLPHWRLAGFYTTEIREAGERQGFHVATFAGTTAILAHTGLPSRHRVGRYGVDVEGFEQLVLPELARPCDLLLIDEIGKMECFSGHFVEVVRSCLDGHTPVVATVARKGTGFIDEVKSRPDVEIWPVDRANRENLPNRLADYVTGIQA